jgi:predicted nucleotidyltransferase
MPDLDAEIARAVEAVSGIAVLVVFGSRARGSHRADSDLDVGVLPERGLPEARRRYMQADVAAALGHLAPAPAERVDVVLMDEATDLLRQRIMETGRVVLCRDARAWRDLRVRTMWEYGDREWERRLYQDAQRRRLEKGEPSGRSGRALVSLERLGKLSR